MKTTEDTEYAEEIIQEIKNKKSKIYNPSISS